MKSTLIRSLIAVLLVAGAAGVYMYPQFQHNDVHANTSPAIGGIFGRENLQLCIANVDGSPAKDEIMQQIHTAFATVKQHPEFEKAGLSAGGGPKIRAGCPSASDLKTEQAGKRTVAVAGPILTYVFITSAEELKGVQFKHYPRVMGYEQMCEGQFCNSVSNALYITAEELNDSAKLVEALTAGIGLETKQAPLYVDGVTPDDKTHK